MPSDDGDRRATARRTAVKVVLLVIAVNLVISLAVLALESVISPLDRITPDEDGTPPPVTAPAR